MSYPIIWNSNFSTRDDETCRIPDAAKAIEMGWDHPELGSALDTLEELIGEHGDSCSEQAIRECREAEEAVVAIWTEDAREAFADWQYA